MRNPVIDRPTLERWLELSRTPEIDSAIRALHDDIARQAADALWRRAGSNTRPDRSGLAITTGIGLLHGFGFSFMLQNILAVDAPNVWQSLLAFNVGVELGQLLVVAAIWPLVLFLRSRPAIIWRATSGTVAIAASAVAAIWMFERTMTLFA